MARINEAEKYCTKCGHPYEIRELEGEGQVQYCPQCAEFHFPVFNTAVSMIVINKSESKILLIKQYGRDSYILVAGYVNRGEDAEDTVRRELLEETGLKADKILFNRSRYFERSNTLMLNWTVFIDESSSIHVNKEIDSYSWFTFDEARKNIRDKSLAQEFLVKYLDSMEGENS
ncbi:MAG: NUDIX domain-containing protein [Sphaerochaetaceae bacterium]|nr:NUDIX domain-containing protein [Sphaerochaetaceae bacterium]